jgi:hypothetical protein
VPTSPSSSLHSAIAGLYFYGRSIRELGASRAAVITSFTPVAVGLLGIPLLGDSGRRRLDRHRPRERRGGVRERRSVAPEMTALLPTDRDMLVAA